MPTQRVPERHNLRPQVTTAQPLVTKHRHRHRGRHGRGQPPQQAAKVVNPGLPGLGSHDVPGHGNRRLAVDPTDHQRRQIVLLRGGIRGQHPRFLCQLPPARGHRQLRTHCSSGAKQRSTSSSWPGPQASMRSASSYSSSRCRRRSVCGLRGPLRRCASARVTVS